MDFRQIKTIQHYFGHNANNYLTPRFQIETNQIENIWLDVVNQHINTRRQLRLVIFAESPLRLGNYFYNNFPNNFLSGLRVHYGVQQGLFINHLLQRDILIFELFKYPLDPKFYKKHYASFVDEHYISSKLNLIAPLFDNDTRFIFRYKMLFEPKYSRMLHHLNAFNSHYPRFDLDGTGQPQNVFIQETPNQIINPLVIPHL
jgi:hypothetical protein